MAFKVIKEDILKANSNVAESVREKLKDKRILAVNIISSPGAGKTSLLENIGPVLKERGVSLEIITGDCFTSKDAERIDKKGLKAIQINTGNACHIDASLVATAMEEVELEGKDLIIIENVGNLVCPAEFDVGEDMKIALLSTAEGHDKPAKYPLLLKESALAIINKVDLLEYVDFDMGSCETDIKNVNPSIDIIKASCKTGEGIEEIVEWIIKKIEEKKGEKK